MRSCLGVVVLKGHLMTLPVSQVVFLLVLCVSHSGYGMKINTCMSKNIIYYSVI